MKRIVRLVFLTLIFSPVVANAQSQFPTFTEPMFPSPGDAVLLGMTLSCSRAAVGSTTNGVINDQFRTIQVTGSTVRVNIETAFNGLGCLFPPFTTRWSLGTFPPGTWQVEVFTANGAFPTVLDRIGTTTFTVNGTVPVDGMRPTHVIVLTLAVLAAGACALRRR